jgi:hypothetical protein
MRTIFPTYPGFQSLPGGIKQALVASENFFFDDADADGAKIAHPNLFTRTLAGARDPVFHLRSAIKPLVSTVNIKV